MKNAVKSRVFAIVACTAAVIGCDAGSHEEPGAALPADVAAQVAPTPDAKGCDATSLLTVPEDPSARGPWSVGVRTLKIGRLTTEVFYPAELGSEQGKAEVKYDLREWLPASQRSKVPDARATSIGAIGGKLYRDLPLDQTHGPYPAVVFIHGTASNRAASVSTLAHWASRGFVVLGADYPGIVLNDELCATLACSCPTSGKQDIPGDVKTQIDALNRFDGGLAFLSGHVDLKRLGISGHSQGGCVTATLSTLPNVQIVIPMSASTNVSAYRAGQSLRSLMYISGINDTVIGYNTSKLGNLVCPANPLPATSDTGAYNASPGAPNVTKRLVGITGGGHLTPTDLCQNNPQGRNSIAEANADGVCGINQAAGIGLTGLFDCGKIALADGIEAVNYASTAALEETLLCQDRTAQFAAIRSKVPAIGDFKESKKN